MRQGPGPEVIEDGVDGLLCDTRSANALAQTMIRAMGDLALRRRIGEAASRRIRETLSLELTARKNVDFYRQVIG
jgi:glycosyltransferase involved in cell wall biosynthesis